MKPILVTGAAGQIGSELTPALRDVFGARNVVAAGHTTQPDRELRESGPFHFIDCEDISSVSGVVRTHGIGTIYHLAAKLSAVAEEAPRQAWGVNVNGLYNVLEVAREYKCRVFVPSSIGVFGPGTPLDDTPQDTIQRPTSMYGVTKVAGELLCDYYFKRFGVDTRGLRYPGLISSKTLPGGGTTDYAVDIFYKAVTARAYTCYLKAGTFLDMMFMPDALRAAMEVMEADPRTLNHRNAFNVSAMSFAPEHIAGEIRRHIPDFTMDFDVDPVRQMIADSWPNYMDDSAAREEWGWRPGYDLKAMTGEMIEKISEKSGVAL